MKAKNPSSISAKTLAKTVHITAIVFVILLGAVVIIGWHTNNETLIQILPELVPMQYNTALGFILCGLGLLFCFWRRELVFICGVVLVLLGSLTLSQYLFGYNLGLDELFMKSYILVKTSHPGRMAPNTALCFLLVGITFILRRKSGHKKSFSLTIALLGAVIVALGTFSLSGYLTEVPTAFGWGEFSLMAFHTSIGFIIVGIGLIVLVISEHRSKLYKNLYWLPAMIFVVSITFTFSLSQALYSWEQNTIRREVQFDADNAKNNLEAEFKTRVLAIERMADRWSERGGGTPFEEWKADSTRYVNDYGSYQAFVWADSSYKVRWAVPLKENESLIGLDLAKEESRRRGLEAARSNDKASITSTINLVQGGRGILIYIPVKRDNEFDGFIIGALRLEDFLKKTLPQSFIENYSFDFFDSGQKVLHYGEETPLENTWTIEETIKSFGVDFKLKAFPNKRTTENLSSSTNEAIFIFGLLMSFLLTAASYLSRKARSSAIAVETANLDLKIEIKKRLEVEKTLVENNVLQNAILSSANYMIISCDPDGKINLFNEAAEEGLHYSAEEIVGKTTPKIFHDVEEVVKRAEELTEELGFEIEPGFETFVAKARLGDIDEREWTYIRKDGVRFPVILSITALRNDEGEIRGFLGIANDITVQKEASEELRASEERFSAFMSNSPAVTSIKDYTGCYLYINETMEKVFEVDSNDLIGKNCFSFLPEETAKEIYENDNYVLETKRSTETVETTIKPNGELQTWLSLRFPINDGTGNLYLGNMSIDITAQVHAEAEQARLTAILEASGDFISSTDPDGSVIYMNQAGRKILNIGEDVDLSNISIPEFHPKWAMDKISVEGRPTAIKDGIWLGETAFLSKTGKDIPISQMILSHKNENGETAYFSTVARDISIQKETETALRISERHNRDLIDKSLGFITAHRLDGKLLSINPAAANALGYEPDELIGRYVIDLIPVGAKTLFGKYLQEIKAQKESSGLISFVTKSGKEVLWHYQNTLYETKGEEPYVLGHAFDVTERKQIEDKLRAAHDAAMKSAKMKSEFLANMSHEIRTPMNGVLGMTDILLDTSLESEQREYAEMIKASANSLLNIINDILDFSKIEAGKLNFETIDFDLRNTVESTVEVFSKQAAAKNIELASLVSKDVKTALRGDPGRLRQVLINLIGNAIKFTEQGEVFIRVDKESETDDQIGLHFSIRDTGIGIEPDSQKYLFEAFTQADGSMTRKFGGTGLGLAISKQLTEIMNGEITVESEPGKGSTFNFTARFVKQLAPQTEIFEMREDFENLRVLVVDDNTTNRSILVHQIGVLGSKIMEAESGKKALEVLRKAAAEGKAFDVALLDLMMPEMDGFDLARRIKADPEIARTHLIMMPSFGQHGHGTRAAEAGVEAYLTKPIKQADLFDCISTVTAKTKVASPNKIYKKKQLITRHSLNENRPTRKEEILVVEDNLVNQKLIQIQLRRLGFEPDMTANGLEALDAWKGKPYSLILMDCQMPKMDGYATSAEIRTLEIDTHIPIVAITANAMKGEREKCIAAGMDDFLTKPFKQVELAGIIEKWLKTSINLKSEDKDSDKVNTYRSETAKHLDKFKFAEDVSIRFNDLEEEVGSEIIEDLVNLFVEDSQVRLNNLKEIVETGNDLLQVKREAHGLKGSSSNIGAQYLRNIFLKIEAAAEAENYEKIVSLTIEAEEAFPVLYEVLKEIQREYSKKNLFRV